MKKEGVEQLLELVARELPNNNISGALEILEEARLIEPDNIELGNLKASCHYLLGDFHLAKELWEEVLISDNDNPMALSRLEKLESPAFRFWLKRYYRAIEDIENKDYVAAQASLQNLMKENDGFVSLYQLLGLTCLALNDERNAMKVWRQGLKLDINNEKLNNYINSPKKGLSKKKPIPQPIYKQGAPKNNLVYIVAGMCVMLLLLQMSISLNSNKGYKNTIHNLQEKINALSAELLKEQSVPAMAIASSNEEATLEISEVKATGDNISLSNEGEKEKHYYKSGYQAYLVKDWEAAISNLGAVIALGSNNYIHREALYYLALSYYSSGNYDNAEKYFLNYLELFPQTDYTDESLYYLGNIFYTKGDFITAKKMMTAIDAYDPNSCYKSTELYRKIID